jgi:hypothetical protein
VILHLGDKAMIKMGKQDVLSAIVIDVDGAKYRIY